MGRILVSASHYDTACVEAVKFLEEKGHEIVFDPSRSFPAYDKEELLYILRDIDASVIGMDFYDKEVFDAAPKLKAVAKFGVGVDNIDQKAASELGVYVLNAPGQNSLPVAEYLVGAIICAMRGIVPFDQEMKKGKWPRQLRKGMKGSTLGLIGFGSTAKDLARLIQPFDMNIIAYDVYQDFESAEKLNVSFVSFEELLKKSDVISMHVPGCESTYHMINKDVISQMKDGVFFVNDSRGLVVNTEDLANALDEGKIAGAALDVFELEPMPADQHILHCENVICTPHIGGETFEAYHDIAMCTAYDIAAVLEGKKPKHCTNIESLKTVF